MENSAFDPNTKLAAVYYNGGKPPHLFRISIDVTLSGLKGQLNQSRTQRRVDGVEYRRLSTDSAGSVQFS